MRKWLYDPVGGPSYNAAGAFEMTLINIGLVPEDNQWTIEETEVFARKYCMLPRFRTGEDALNGFRDGDYGDVLRKFGFDCQKFDGGPATSRGASGRTRIRFRAGDN